MRGAASSVTFVGFAQSKCVGFGGSSNRLGTRRIHARVRTFKPFTHEFYRVELVGVSVVLRGSIRAPALSFP